MPMLARFHSRIVIVRDEIKPRRPRFFYLSVKGYEPIRHIIEQRFHLVVEERQPMLHARMFAAFAYRSIKRVIARHSTKRCHIAGAETADRFAVEMDFARGHQIKP